MLDRSAMTTPKLKTHRDGLLRALPGSEKFAYRYDFGG